MGDFFTLEVLGAFIGVLLIDLILSGDNAVVIALAVRNLEGDVRRRAIQLGVAAAIGLRIIFVFIVAFLVTLPLLQLIGGLLLIYISWQLVRQEDEEANVKAGSGLWQSIRIIAVADAVMSLDNVIALVAISRDSAGEPRVWLIALGIALTIPIIIFGATILSNLMNRFPIIVYAGAALLVYVAVELMFDDRLGIVQTVSEATEGYHRIIALAAAAIFTVIALLVARRDSKTT
ncbi:MAG: TerC family protein [Actinomycetota bacterium]|nr:TerC family protein [Actinomycetota bacterium]